MGKFYDSIEPKIEAWAMRQPVFFVATAPLHGSHVNVSPKGLPSTSLAILGPNQVAYLDRSGSGCETIAHTYENGRVTLMFCSFGPVPRILRFFCRGTVVERWDEEGRDTARGGEGANESSAYSKLVAKMGLSAAPPAGARAIILLDVFKVQTSCGFGVPQIRRELYAPSAASTADDEKEIVANVLPTDDEAYGTAPDETSVFEARPTLDKYWSNRVRTNPGVELSYLRQKSMHSLDGLPAVRAVRPRSGRPLWFERAEARALRMVRGEKAAVAMGFLLACLLYIFVVAAPRGALFCT